MPLSSEVKLLSSFSIGQYFSTQIELELQYNEIHAQDSVFVNSKQDLYFFDTIVKLKSILNPAYVCLDEWCFELAVKITLMISDEKFVHTRNVYKFLDLLGDYGGLQEVLLILVGFLIAPFAEHSFTLEAIRKLYLAKTKDETLFKQPVSENH